MSVSRRNAVRWRESLREWVRKHRFFREQLILCFSKIWTHILHSVCSPAVPLHLFFIPTFQLSISVFTIWVRSSLPEGPQGWQRGSYPTQKVVRQSVYPWLPPWVSTRHFVFTRSFYGSQLLTSLTLLQASAHLYKKNKNLVAIWWKTALPLRLHTAPLSVLMAHSCVYLPLNLRLQHKTGH